MHFSRGLTSFLVIAAAIVFYFAFLRFDRIARLIAFVGGILQPVILGFVFAYLLDPIVKNVEKIIRPFLLKRMKNEKRVQSLSRSTGIACSLIVACFVIVLLLNMVIPELYKSIRDMVLSFPQQMNDAMTYMENWKIEDTTISSLVTEIVETGAEFLQSWVRTDLMSQVNSVMSSLTVGVINVVETTLDVIIGVIVSVYVLSSKEKFVGQCKKITYALFSQEHANLILQITRKSNEIFGGFVIGKIIDSIIIGIICFVVLSILNMPYTLLVSVIVGVTNVIPFFGPFIGAIPSAILILLAEPVQGVYFLIFVLLLQQFDGNILGPKILGDSTGLSAFWVVFSILLGGGLFGFVGMVMGVPTFAVIYYLVNMFIEQKLYKKKLPTASGVYQDIDYVDEATGKPVYIGADNKEENKKEEKEEE